MAYTATVFILWLGIWSRISYQTSRILIGVLRAADRGTGIFNKDIVTLNIDEGVFGKVSNSPTVVIDIDDVRLVWKY